MKTIFRQAALVLDAVCYIVLLVFFPGSIVTLLAGLPVCLWLTNAIHELAHLFAYKLLGLSWKRLNFSVFSFYPENEKLCCKIQWEQSLFRGECACAYDKSIPLWKYTVALLAGIAACAVCAVVCFLIPSPVARCFGIAFSLNTLVNLLPPANHDLKILKSLKRNSAS